MDLTKVRVRKQQAAAYMEDEINNIIRTCDKREPGSKGEEEAVDYMATELQKYSDDVKKEPFDVHTASFFGWIYFSVPLAVAAVGAYFYRPWLAIILIILGMTFMTGQFLLYRRMLDKLFKKSISHNLTAIKKPTGEVKRRIFFNGHPDAAYEWTLNYHLGGTGYIAHVVTCFIGLGYVVVVSVIALILNGIDAVAYAGVVRILGYTSIFFVPFWIGMFFMSNSKRVVDGANDNLTGCYMGIAVMKALHDEGITLEHTEVGVILSGSEEAGLRGAKAWCEAHKDDYKDVETIIISYDTIHDGRFIGVNRLDLNNLVKADKTASDLFKNAADEIGVPCENISVPLGATDSAAFNQGGFKATGITAMDHVLRDYYHTRKDTIGNLDPKGLADCFEISVKALENYDEGKY